MDKLSDDEIIAKLNASDRAVAWMVVALVVVPVMLIAIFAGAFFTGHAALLQSEGVQIAVSILVVAGILFFIQRLGRRYQPEAYLESMEPRILRRRIDAHHRYWRWTLVTCLFSASCTTLSFSRTLANIARPNQTWAFFMAGTIIFTIALFSTIVMIGPGWFSRDMHAILNDDFIRALRGRAERLGYVTLMIALAGVLIVAIWRPTLTLPALCWALYAGFAIPALYYVIADWRAGREK